MAGWRPHLRSLLGGAYPSSSCQHVGRRSAGMPLQASSLSKSRSTFKQQSGLTDWLPALPDRP